jgi:uncharacterized pyridoxamine 5'-phosphate oxidase family protein
MKRVYFNRREIQFLRSNEICRVATCNNNLPHVTPVSYIFDDGKSYFATDYNTQRYANLKKNNRISLVFGTTENDKNQAIVTRGSLNSFIRVKNLKICMICFITDLIDQRRPMETRRSAICHRKP